MTLAGKPDWPDAKERTEAWWNGEIIDRAPIKITAPSRDIENCETWILSSAFPMVGSEGKLREYAGAPKDLHAHFTDPYTVIPRVERLIEGTYWAGEAFPVMFPVSISMVAILANYLGSDMQYVDQYTTWSEPIIADWTDREPIAFDENNYWWRISRKLLAAAAERAAGRYFVGVPDLNGPSEILSLLRGHEAFALDTLENEAEIVVAMDEVNRAWLRYWEASHGIIHQHLGGYIFMMSIWSEAPATDLQCDFSGLISPEAFDKLFLPFIRQQAQWIPRTIYHLDGSDALRHLDSILSVEEISGIQWVPGAGSASMSEWIPLLERIQRAGKSVFIACEKHEVETLLGALKPELLMIETTCGSRREADELLARVRRAT